MTDTLGPLRAALDGLAFAAHETPALSDSADVQAWIAKVMDCAAAEVAKAVQQERERTMYSRRPGLWALEAREVLQLIAAPMRPDGTWNRDREACRQLAAEVLGRD